MSFEDKFNFIYLLLKVNNGKISVNDKTIVELVDEDRISIKINGEINITVSISDSGSDIEDLYIDMIYNDIVGKEYYVYFGDDSTKLIKTLINTIIKHATEFSYTYGTEYVIEINKAKIFGCYMNDTDAAYFKVIWSDTGVVGTIISLENGYCFVNNVNNIMISNIIKDIARYNSVAFAHVDFGTTFSKWCSISGDGVELYSILLKAGCGDKIDCIKELVKEVITYRSDDFIR